MKLFANVIPILYSISLLGAPCAKNDPCTIRPILDKYCVKCHSEPLQSFGGLDMSQWVTLPDGTHNFLHLDAKGEQYPWSYTSTMILIRITEEGGDRMPLGETIPEPDFSQLDKWIGQK